MKNKKINKKKIKNNISNSLINTNHTSLIYICI